MKKEKIPVSVGDILLARQKYSVAWPSKVIAVRAESVDVYFFGDGRTGCVKRNELSQIHNSTEVILQNLRRNVSGYSKGIVELERIMSVPDNLSVFRLL